jgi:hypothetical protein
MLLRDSRFRGVASYGEVTALARGALASDRGGYRGEFLRLVEASQRLAPDGVRSGDDGGGEQVMFDR